MVITAIKIGWTFYILEIERAQTGYNVSERLAVGTASTLHLNALVGRQGGVTSCISQAELVTVIVDVLCSAVGCWTERNAN